MPHPCAATSNWGDIRLAAVGLLFSLTVQYGVIMPFVPQKLDTTFRIQAPGSEMKEEMRDVYFEMQPLNRHQLANLYEKRIKNNKGTSKFLEDQWVACCIGWEGVEDETGNSISCDDEVKREWFRNPSLQPLIEDLLSELDNLSREQLGITEKN